MCTSAPNPGKWRAQVVIVAFPSSAFMPFVNHFSQQTAAYQPRHRGMRVASCVRRRLPCRRNHNMERTMNKALVVVFSSAIFVAGTAGMIISLPAKATPQFASDTGKPCGQCHESPSGAGKLTAFGEAFKKNGYKLPQ
jgi:hypothetical protein